ncbi:hypothetical protein IOC47_22820 [Enterobacter cloacae]|uniref:hypothetical protein n=1 Tax=Enterobacter cloacae complex TaxID=354276 RepID=UPI0018EE3FE6|nr:MULTISPECIES: hypothetical protein [Enterobacter cloacae complex]HBM7601037.1 hypothetical protein [Enterobacter asburiae]HCI6708520.1 hypothetical protein [Klebsiella quasipneumoniae subsp. similipneumoniae]ELS4527918.1 hypothetical protein [Enterobacter hormaechei]MBJ6502844.1 hypothetical protein [Enterobacter hormaechei]MCD1394649.1 hypothetical protein [Enterobacter cloacae]
MPDNSNENETNYQLSSLWDLLSDYPRVRLHRTIHFGRPLVHVLDDEGRELARRINSTGQWEWRTRSPERWTPQPGEFLVEYEFDGDEELDCFQLDLLDGPFGS